MDPHLVLPGDSAGSFCRVFAGSIVYSLFIVNEKRGFLSKYDENEVQPTSTWARPYGPRKKNRDRGLDDPKNLKKRGFTMKLFFGASVHLTKFVGVCCLLLGTMVSRPCNASNAFLYTPGDWWTLPAGFLVALCTSPRKTIWQGLTAEGHLPCI